MLHAELKLLAVGSAVSCARAFTASKLQCWRKADLADVACLVVSELVTNAVKSTGTVQQNPDATTLARLPLIVLRLSLEGGVLLVEVGDVSTTPPELHEQHEHAESGRGLFLVATLAERWSYYPVETGKVVWAQLATVGDEKRGDDVALVESAL